MANPYFNAVYYLQNNPDLMAAGVTAATAWDHYVQYGANEAYAAGGSVRAPNDWFDARAYLNGNPDLIAAGVTPETALDHFQQYGANELRSPNAAIAASPITAASLVAYVNANADIATALSITIPATTLTAAQQDAVVAQFYGYGINESRPSAPTNFEPQPNPGQTFTLTTGVDNLTGTSGNDTFTGGTAEMQAADVINGGGGTDTAKLFLDAGNDGFTSSAVEVFQLQSSNAGGATFTANNVSGLTKIINDRSSTNLTVDALQNNVDLVLNNVAANTKLAFASGKIGSTTGTLKVETKTTGSTATPRTLEVDLAGTDKITTLDITATEGTSNLALASTGAGELELKTVTVSGDKKLILADGGNTPLATVTTVNASAMTAGGLVINLTNNTKDVTVTGSKGDDRVTFGANQLNANDVIDLGDGTKDAVIINQAAFNASTNDAVKSINSAKNVEIAGTSAAANIVADMSVFSTVKAFEVTAAVTGSNGVGVVSAVGNSGTAALNATLVASNTIYVDANLTGGNGAAGASGNDSGGAGANAITLAPKTNSGDDGVTLVFQKDAATTILGGDGGAKTASGSGADGAAGLALSADSLETINIQTASAKDDITFTAGNTGAAVAGATTVQVGANGKIVISGAGDVDFGVVASAGAATAKNITVDGTNMSGKLTVTLAGENDKAIAGSGGSAITVTGANDGGTNQVHTITFGSGVDEFSFGTNVVGTNTTGTKAVQSTITNFTSGIDKIKWEGTGTPTFNSTKVDVSGAASLGGALDLAAAATTTPGTDGVVRWFTWGSDSYVVFDASNNATFTDGTDSVLKLVGISSVAAGDIVLS